MSDENIYIQQRFDKVRAIRAQGKNPYPNTIRPNALLGHLFEQYNPFDAAKLEALNATFSVSGRMMARRTFGKAGFLRLRDRSGELQVFCQKDSLSAEDFETFNNLDLGDIVFVEGHLFRTKTDELTLKVSKLQLVVKSIRGLPEKWHGLTDVETRYRQRYVDLLANADVQQTFIKRSQIVTHIRQFLLDREFLEVETPMMHPIPGGAAAKPFITHHNKLDMDLYLRIAPELYLKRLVVGGLERVFEINRNFRNEGISIQHNPEFTMLEFYQSYATYEDLMKLTEEMLSSVALKICGSYEVPYMDFAINWAPDFKKLPLKQSLIDVGGLDAARIDETAYLDEQIKKHHLEAGVGSGGNGVKQTLLFESLVEAKLMQPTFITQFPTEVSPLARRNDQNPEVTDRFELYVYGREIANAFSELNDPADQKERFLDQVKSREAGNEEAMYFDADYIRALEYGMPPTAGEGIGIDRLVMLFTNSPSIRDVILFPQLRSEK